MKKKTFFISSEESDQIFDSLTNYLIQEKYHVKKFFKYDGFTLNIFKSSPIKTFFGLKEEFNINVTIHPNAFTIYFSDISLLDKIIVGCLSYLLFPLFLLFPLYGYFKQINLTKKIDYYLNSEIDLRIRRNNFYSEKIFS